MFCLDRSPHKKKLKAKKHNSSNEAMKKPISSQLHNGSMNIIKATFIILILACANHQALALPPIPTPIHTYSHLRRKH